ncbi:MAG: hypothetical protein F4139_01580 [Gemmatimonadetes bacterium]|nr:hypothetical protein [Gemmatimonadota bacterium]MYB97226.1 hypothetical protein [Gemmatimonadota bacterium]MYB99950.1 hypothetical protein [Gemmatimonadota bacterium]MYH51620.1 hypothetical protein [Gemmatimonadota bacterium]MYK66546.1 hypothetical protein [Gemmatimonadota bacterium]
MRGAPASSGCRGSARVAELGRASGRWGLRGCFAIVGALVAVGGTWVDAHSQQSRPNVFLDCREARCNYEYYRTEIDWVNWVRDRQVADVHVIMTAQGTGAGGREYLFDFIGTDEESPYSHRHSYKSNPTDTDREVLDALANTLALGLGMFANESGYRGLATVVALETGQPEGLVSPDEVDDPWNLWVFRIRGEAGMEGESTYRNVGLEGNLSAWRTTPTWKFSISGGVGHNRLRIDLSDGTFRDNRTRWNVDSRLVYALAERWSVGVIGSTGRFLSYNLDYRLALTPSVEYSVFPYEETTRRSFTFVYGITGMYHDYTERTVYLETEETRYEQMLEIRFNQRQPWGSAWFGTSGTQFLHDTDLYRVSLWAGASVRIVRGFSVNISGNVSWVRDQIFLSAEGATDEEALLRLQQRPTDFDYGMEVGFSYQFGSIYNNVVNNRLRPRR